MTTYNEWKRFAHDGVIYCASWVHELVLIIARGSILFVVYMWYSVYLDALRWHDWRYELDRGEVQMAKYQWFSLGYLLAAYGWYWLGRTNGKRRHDGRLHRPPSQIEDYSI